MKIWATFDSFSPPAFLQGRAVANEWFLKALIKYSSFSEFWFFVGDLYEKERFYDWHPYLRGDRRVKIFLREEALFKDFSDVVVHKPDIELSSLMLWRQESGKVFPLTGVTHSLSYPRFVDEFFKMLLLCCDCDCLVCTSPTAKRLVSKIIDSFKERNLVDLARLNLKTIPLGVFTSEVKTLGEEEKQQLKSQLGLGTETIFLHFGRITEYSKADLLPLFRAASRLKTMGYRLKIIIAGASGESNYPDVLRTIAQVWGMNDVVSIFPNPTEADKQVLFAVADCLISISDNFQETFGLVILEAMAWGLPVIATDWGGYRDIVKDGVTGFLIPSYAIETIEEQMNIFSLLSYEAVMHLLWAQTIIVDEYELMERMRTLCENKELAKRMAEAARLEVQQYDWRNVIAMYEELWEDLMSRKEYCHSKEQAIRLPRFDVKWFYHLYPKNRIKKNTLVDLSDWARDYLSKGLGLYEAISVCVSQDGIKRFLENQQFPVSIENALREITLQELSWLIKQGWLKVVV